MQKSKASNDTQKWEYAVVYIRANAEAHKATFDKTIEKMGRPGVLPKYPQYSPGAFNSDLNGYGVDGWELMHIEPVRPDDNQAVVVYEEGDHTVWDNYYFCVFKRPKVLR